MTTYRAPWALLPGGLAKNVRLAEEDGRWTAVTPDAAFDTEPDAQSGDIVRLDGVVLPGLANCHSHAFHRALRGRTHDEGGTVWTWRERMYHVAAQLDPENYLALARATYAEMALAGVTAVGEFHYVHHRPDGTSYDDPNAMGAAVRQAAHEAGVRLTLLDTCYLHGGLTADGHVPLSAEQRRFGDGSVEGWLQRHERLVEDARADENTVVGTAVHSVRAVSADDITALVAACTDEMVHAHVSEQSAENAAAQGFYGSSPIGVFAHAGALGERFTAVHATHLSDDGINALGDAGATACFCPTTERDLADGIGPARPLHDAGVGLLSLGSDQHAVIDLFEEARGLEMHERLTRHERGRFTPGELLNAATRHDTIGWPDAGRLAVGQRADAVCVKLDTVRTAGTAPDQVLLAATAADVRDVLSDGVRVVADGRHRLGDVGALLHDAIDPFWSTP